MSRAFLLATVLACAAADATITYSGSFGGSWYTVGAWDLGRFPRHGDVTVIDNDRVIFDEADEHALYATTTQGDDIIVEGDSGDLVVSGDSDLVIGEADEAPEHCVVGAWSAYTACTKSCGTGSQSRSRTNTPPAHGGDVCPHAQETRNCNGHPCPVNCVQSAFSAYTPCTKSCGTGYQSRSRSVTTAPRFGGVVCMHGAETRACNEFSCAVDCVVGTWGPYGECDSPCGTGTKTRSRSLTQPLFGGLLCPSATSTAPCNVHDCPKICSHTKCVYQPATATKASRTLVMHNGCDEQNGSSYHCQYTHGSKTWTLLGGESVTHANQCVCYCDHDSAGNSITHKHKERIGGGWGATRTHHLNKKLSEFC